VPNGKRDALIDHLKKNDIGCGVYYPIPVHKQNYYTKNLGYDQELPETEKASLEVLSLPVHPGLSAADLESIVSTVNEFTG
jgi:dTDP-4-amino-4,6-dideoxygalactose transaminase